MERCLLSLVNEGLRILQEGIAERSSDIDVIYVHGYGFPRWQGGPMYWADQVVGLPTVLQRIQHYHQLFPERSYWQPADLLTKLVAKKLSLFEFDRLAEKAKL